MPSGLIGIFGAILDTGFFNMRWDEDEIKVFNNFTMDIFATLYSQVYVSFSKLDLFENFKKYPIY